MDGSPRRVAVHNSGSLLNSVTEMELRKIRVDLDEDRFKYPELCV